MRLAATFALACLSISSVATVADSPVVNKRYELNIPRQPLDTALKDLAQQTGLQVGRFSDAVKGDTVVGPLTGEFTAEAALQTLLAPSGLTYRSLNDRAILILRPEDVAQLPSAQVSPAASHSDMGMTPVDSGEHGKQWRLAQGGTNGSKQNLDQSAAGGDNARDLQEVVVTAQKRQERLIDTPQSVSVLSADDLAKMGATQFRDYANTVPGLSFSTAGAGNTQVSLRGVTIGQDLGATVGIYVDEAPYGSSQVFAFGPYLALDVGLFDIERIEVLRGPQGTLYGASTMGGLIKYVSKRPDAQRFSGSVRSGVSSTSSGDINFDIAGGVNLPLVADKAALRVSAFQSRDGGYIDNLATGQERVNRADIYGGRLDLLLTPNDQLDIRIAAFMQNINRDGEATADYTFAGAKPIGSLNQSRLFEEPFSQRFRLVSGTLGYDFGGMSLTSISTYQTAASALTWDLSATFAPLLNSFGFGPFGGVANPNWSKVDKFSHESRLASDGGGKVEWVVGGFYTQEKSELYTEFVLRDLAGAPAPNDLFTYRAPTSFREYAAFGDLTVRLTEKFDITGGVRYARNDQEFTQFGTGTLGASVPTRESDEDVFTYLGSARYHFSDRSMAYVRYATGYRPGGPNIATAATASPTFDSDELKSYEFGFKAQTEDRRFAIDWAAYQIDWNNIQMSVNIGGFTGYGNAPGGATIRGMELALTSRPTQRLTFTGAFAYQDATLDEADAELGGAKGERLPNVPRFTGTLNTDYALANTTFEPTLGATLRHVGERNSSFDASAGFPQYRLPDYTTVDVRAGLTLGRFDTQLYVRNLTDERGQLSLFFAQFGARVAIMQPRTYGVSLSTQF